MFVTEHSGANSLQFIYTHQEQKQQMPGYTLYLGMPSTQNSHKLESLTKSQTKKKNSDKIPSRASINTQPERFVHSAHQQ